MTMTLTMTHPNEVSTRVNFALRTRTGEVVTPAKRVCQWCEKSAKAGRVVNTCWKRIDFYLMTQRVEPFFEYDSKSWIFFCKWLKELNFFWRWLKELILFFEYDSKKWASFFFFWIWLTEVRLFCEYGSKKWTFFWIWLKEVNFFFWTWLKEVNFRFLNMTQRSGLFLENDSKNWTIFFKKTQRIEPYFTWLKIRLKELNLFFNMTQRFLKTTQRIELFFFNVMQRIDFF